MIVERGNRTLHHRGGTWTLPHLSLLSLGMVVVMCKGGNDTAGGGRGGGIGEAEDFVCPRGDGWRVFMPTSTPLMPVSPSDTGHRRGVR